MATSPEVDSFGVPAVYASHVRVNKFDSGGFRIAFGEGINSGTPPVMGLYYHSAVFMTAECAEGLRDLLNRLLPPLGTVN